jgi:hypothetical protein
MADEQSSAPKDEAPTPEPEESPASRDLAEGLDLMLRAARKAMSRVNPTKLEAAGRRAVERLENLDARKVSELGKKAAKNLDPRRIEEIAEEAGRELIHVIERVAERVESAVAGATPRSKSAPPPAAEADKPSETPDEPRPRVRIDDT